MRGPTGRRVKSARHGTGRRWLAVWQEPGGARRKKAFTTRDAAVQHLLTVDAQIAAGTYLHSSKITLTEFAAAWQVRQIHLRASSRASIGSHLKQITAELGTLPLSEVTPDVVQDVIIRWDSKYRPNTVGHLHRTLKQVLGAAVRANLIPRNPATGTLLPRKDAGPVEPLSTAQVWAIADAVPAKYHDLVLLAAATGMRSGELRGLTTDRIRFTDLGASIRVDRQLATVKPPTWGPPKTARSNRSITVDETTAKMLRRYMVEYPPHPSGLVFTNRYGWPLEGRSMVYAWPQVAGRGWHDLRHYHASLLIAGGLSPRAVADRLGHENPATTLRVYSHLWEDDEDRAVSAVTRMLWPVRLHSVEGSGPRTAPKVG